jgi:HlyD family secretion protein
MNTLTILFERAQTLGRFWVGSVIPDLKPTRLCGFIKAGGVGAMVLTVNVMLGCSGNSPDRISASGTIEATEVTISAKVGGQVMLLLVDEGSIARRGDTLAVIDPTDYQIQLRQAQANHAAALAQDAQTNANLKNAQDDLRRMKELWSSKSITQKQLDDAQTRFIVASQTTAASAAHRNLALAQLEAAKKKVSDCFIVSPLEGTVTQKTVEEGEFVGTGTPIVRIARLDKVYLTIYVSEVELGRIKLGQEASIFIDAYKDRPFSGNVIYISPIAEFTPKNIQTKEDRTKLVFGVKIEVNNSDGSLKPGIPADAIVSIKVQ